MSDTARPIYDFGPFRVDGARRLLLRDGSPVRLTGKAFDILLLLLEEKGRLVEKDELMRRVWPHTVVEENNLTVNISALRKSLGESRDEHRYLVTVPGRGYQFVAEVHQLDGEQAAPAEQGARFDQTALDAQAIAEPGTDKGEGGLRPGGGDPVARPPAPASLDPEVPPKLEPSRRGLVVVGAVVAVLALALAGVWLARRGSDAATAPTNPSAAGSKRMAVLPFENLGAVEDGYFADGMTDEVRSKLAGLSGLAVIASASASEYKATTKPPEQIAKELGVGYLLVAKVRWQKSGQTNRIRLTSELVELAGGGAPTTRWQEAFEADLTDVFRVQGDIATKVARSLELALSGTERGRLAARPTSNLAAYDAYLRGLEIERADAGQATLRYAAAQYEQAVALDPEFALAWARLSITQSVRYRIGLPPLQAAEAAEAARKAAERAMELAPSLPEGHRALAGYYGSVRKDPKKALEMFERGLTLAPDDALLLRGLALTERSRGRWEEALAHLRRARELDPRSWQSEETLGHTLLLLRRSGEAREACDRGLVLAPANLEFIEYKGMTFLQGGDLAGARAVLAATPREVEPTALVAFFALYADLHWVLDDAQRDLLLRLTPGAFDGDRASWGIVLAQASALRGDQAKVREYAEEARKAFAQQVTDDPRGGVTKVLLGLALAYLGRTEEALREGERAVALWSIPKPRLSGAYIQHQLVRIHILLGSHDRALDLLEPLLKVPYHLTPGWLRIDPNFDPLRGNPRFDKLAQGT